MKYIYIILGILVMAFVFSDCDRNVNGCNATFRNNTHVKRHRHFKRHKPAKRKPIYNRWRRR